MDIKCKASRSYNMSKIRSKNTNPEIITRKLLYSKGIRYRCNVKGLPGKPDIAIKKYKLIIEVMGCYWHGHKECKYFVEPKSNVKFWKNKIKSNIERDQKNFIKLNKMGYKVFYIWECHIKTENFKIINEAISYISNRKSIKKS